MLSTSVLRLAMRVLFLRDTTRAAPQREAITAASLPLEAGGVSTMTWSNLRSSSPTSRRKAGRSSSSSGLGGRMPTGITNRLGMSAA